MFRDKPAGVRQEEEEAPKFEFEFWIWEPDMKKGNSVTEKNVFNFYFGGDRGLKASRSRLYIAYKKQ